MKNDAANDNQAGFTGHMKDSETGLNYMQARYYDPVIGRFLSIDPVTFMDTGNPGMFNRYAYVHNDPINGIDPFGLECYAVASRSDIGGSACDTQDELNSAISESLPDESTKEYGGFTFSGNVEVFENDEFGNSEYTSTDTKTLFYYTQIDGDSQSVDLGAPPSGAITAWHSHPKYTSDGAGGFEESPLTQYFSDALSYFAVRGGDGTQRPSRHYSAADGDIAYAYSRNIPLTLFTPQGGIKTASPSQIVPQVNTTGGFYLKYSGKQ